MGVMNLFYTDKCVLMTSTTSKPNMFGVVDVQYQELASDIPCCLTPISTSLAREKYGVDSSSSFEVSMDMADGVFEVRQVKAIQYDGEVYIVQSYQQFSEFLILPKSVTFLVKKRDN